MNVYNYMFISYTLWYMYIYMEVQPIANPQHWIGIMISGMMGRNDYRDCGGTNQPGSHSLIHNMRHHRHHHIYTCIYIYTYVQLCTYNPSCIYEILWGFCWHLVLWWFWLAHLVHRKFLRYTITIHYNQSHIPITLTHAITHHTFDINTCHYTP